MNQTIDSSALFKRLFLLTSLAFAAGGFAAGGFGEAPAGLLTLFCSPQQLTCDAFTVAGPAGAFFNAALVGLLCCLALCSRHAKATSTSFLAYFLTVGFSFYGINVLNMLPCLLGTWLYALLRREPFGKFANFALFTTGLAPVVSELMFRYPNAQARALTPLGAVLGIAAGAAAGFVMPMICGHSVNAHKGYSLYSAALPVGILAYLFVAIAFRTLGVEQPSNTSIGEGYGFLVNIFCFGLFALYTVAGYWLSGKSFAPLRRVLASTGYKTDLSADIGIGPALLHIGLYGLFILGYYNLIGAPFTGLTLGIVLCMLSAAASGAHVYTVLPILIGYAIASTFGFWELTTPAILVGACFASGLAPIAGRFGVIPGILAGLLHACAVTQTPQLHGGFCLYNGGLTACVLAIVLAPLLESLFVPNDEFAVLARFNRKSGS